MTPASDIPELRIFPFLSGLINPFSPPHGSLASPSSLPLASPLPTQRRPCSLLVSLRPHLPSYLLLWEQPCSQVVQRPPSPSATNPTSCSLCWKCLLIAWRECFHPPTSSRETEPLPEACKLSPRLLLPENRSSYSWPPLLDISTHLHTVGCREVPWSLCLLSLGILSSPLKSATSPEMCRIPITYMPITLPTWAFVTACLLLQMVQSPPIFQVDVTKWSEHQFAVSYFVWGNRSRHVMPSAPAGLPSSYFSVLCAIKSTTRYCSQAHNNLGSVNRRGRQHIQHATYGGVKGERQRKQTPKDG